NEPRAPLEEVQVDFKDITSVSPEQSRQGKRQHVIETCNFVDAGTSIALWCQSAEDFQEQTALQAVIAFLRLTGCPAQMTFDRDPRWVGSVSGRDFPSPLRRLLLCVGIQPCICPPHRPDKNAYVERYHRSLKQECLQKVRPESLQEVQEATERYRTHYNEERPHQGRACQNRPPRVAYPTLPPLPPLPERVDPDAWLSAVNRKRYLRHVGRDGCITVDLACYYIDTHLAKQAVLLEVDAAQRAFAVWQENRIIKWLPIKGLVGQELPLEEYLQLMQGEALAAARRSPRNLHQLSLWKEGAGS
ncbi:integrase core domain-containing protein, partial [Dictyobacter arantiisoli]|uniref:integrase core domain-containing protein n=1 Tax=Dictyobacter arantiisoli TaxID=2014874 RepID=UPI0011EE238E